MKDDLKDTHLRIHVLASGSKGNCTVIEYGKSILLHDVGISARRITQGLKNLGLDIQNLEGIFISHEHADHVVGLRQMLKQYDVPVYTKEGTWREILRKQDVPSHRIHRITRSSFVVGKLTIEPFSVSHDAADPLGASYISGDEKATIVTDTGIVTDTILYHLDDSQKLVLEANYDPYLLKVGPYPFYLKERVAGEEGHLSNEHAAQALLMMKRPKFMEVVLAHRSENNNTSVRVTQTVGNMLVKGGIRIGKEMRLQHGQPNTCISMITPSNAHYKEEKKIHVKTNEMGIKKYRSIAETVANQLSSTRVETLAKELAMVRSKHKR